MIIVLSPAKSLNFESEISYKNHTIPEFEKEIPQLISKMRNFSSEDLQNLMKISPKLGELNFNRFQNFEKTFNQKNSRPALLAFNGDVYSKIDSDNFSDEDFNFAQNHLRILSGLYGLLKPLDLIQPYRLEMGTNFKKTKLDIESLYQFWDNKITDKINNENGDYLINLASEEYFSAIKKDHLNKKIINIIFKEEKAGKLKIIGMSAKRARGMMANFIIKNKITKIADLKNFAEENYQFKPELSDESNWIFTR